MDFEKIAEYDVKEEISRGGMGIVYRAHDPRFNRFVAIKLLGAEFSKDAVLRRRFIQEARTVARLQHDAIVPVYDFGEHEKRPFIIMRLMSNQTLTDKIRGGAIPPDEVAAILLRLGDALDFAHQNGVVHRDLKPDNILFDENDQAYLTDFGIAKVIEATTDLTRSNTIMGTWPYISPESFNGSRDVDFYSDIYALGAILYEMLTGYPPFQANTAGEWMSRHLFTPVPNILEQNPTLPPECQTIIEKALAKEATHRFSSAMEMAAAFAEAVTPTRRFAAPLNTAPDTSERTLPTAPSELRPSTHPATPLPAAKQTAPKWLIPALALLAGVSVVAFLLFGGRNAPTPVAPTQTAAPSPTTPATATAEPEPVAPTPEPFNIIILSHAEDAIWEQGDTIAIVPDSGILTIATLDEPIQLLSNGEPMSLILPNRDALYLDENTAVSLTAISTINEAEETAVSLTSGTIVAVSNQAPVQISMESYGTARLNSGTLGVQQLGRTFQVDCLEGSCRFANGNAAEIELDGGEQISSLDVAATAPADYLTYAPFVQTDIVPLPTATVEPTVATLAVETAVSTPVAAIPTPASAAPVGLIVMTCFAEGFDDLCTIDPATGSYNRITNTQSTDFYASISPTTGQIIFSSRRDGSFLLYTTSPSGDAVTQIGPTNIGSLFAPTYSPDGTQIAFTAAANNTQNIWIMNSDGTNPTQLTDLEGESVDAVWSPDGTQIVFATEKEPDNVDAGMEHFIINRDGTNLREIVADVEQIGGRSDWSPDGQWLVFYAGPRDKTQIYLTDINGTQLYQLTDEGSNLAPTFSPDGNWIAYTSFDDGDGEIFIMRLDGSGKQQLTSNSYTDWQPRWGIRR